MQKQSVIVVGGGLGGLLMAIYLAQDGYEIQVYERLPDLRVHQADHGQSINMTLTLRGVHSLQKVGLWENVRAIGVPLRGRMVHHSSGTSHFHPYGKTEEEVLYSISRRTLNCLLLNAAEKYPSITLNFNMHCEKVDKHQGIVYFRNRNSQELLSIEADFIVGADGAFSTVRQQIQRGELANYYQEFMDWGYKELHIPVDVNGCPQLDPNSLHVWTHPQCMLLAFPNLDGSLTSTLIMPFEGEISFANVDTIEAIHAFFIRHFPEVHSLMPNLECDFLHNPVGKFLTTRTAPWYFKDRVVLLGDACHSVFPFYGQGMNATFEDCRVLAQCLQENDNLSEAFKCYQQLRKHNLDTLSELSRQNFLELRDGMRSRWNVKRHQVDQFLHRTFPSRWQTLYGMIAHTDMEYSKALSRANLQHRLSRGLGIDFLIAVLVMIEFFSETYKNLLVRLRGE